MTLQELETNQKLKYWYDHISAQQSSNLSIVNYCKVNHLTPSVFYDYKKKIKQLICDDINTNGNTSAVVPFVAVPKLTSDDKVIITKGTIRIEIDVGTSYQTIEPLIRSLLC